MIKFIINGTHAESLVFLTLTSAQIVTLFGQNIKHQVLLHLEKHSQIGTICMITIFHQVLLRLEKHSKIGTICMIIIFHHKYF